MVKVFSRVQIALHWIVGALILFNLVFSDGMSSMWRQIEQGSGAATSTAAWAHIIAGSLVLALVAWRLTLRFTRGVPAAPEGDGRSLRLVGEAGHVALYVLMISLPVSGLLAWYGGVTALADLHADVLKVLMWIVIATHVAAALYHQFILKDGLLNRMRRPQD